MSDVLSREQVERACIGLLNDAAIKGQIGLTTTIVLLSANDAALRREATDWKRNYDECLEDRRLALNQRDALREQLEACHKSNADLLTCGTTTRHGDALDDGKADRARLVLVAQATRESAVDLRDRCR